MADDNDLNDDGGSQQDAPDTGNEGGDTPSFHENLPEEIREEPSLQDIEDVGTLAKSYVHAQKMIGKERLPVPSGEDDEAWNDVYDIIGRPEAPDAYELPEFGEDDFFQPDEDTLNGFLEKAHEAGLGNNQVKAVLDWYREHANSAYAQIEQSREAEFDTSMQELRKEFGRATDEKVDAANQALRHYGGEDAAKLINEAGLANNPTMVKLFANLGDTLSEDDLAGKSNSSMGRTPTKATQEWNELQYDKEFQEALYDRDHPGHKDAVERKSALFRDMYPEESE